MKDRPEVIVFDSPRANESDVSANPHGMWGKLVPHVYAHFFRSTKNVLTVLIKKDKGKLALGDPSRTQGLRSRYFDSFELALMPTGHNITLNLTLTRQGDGSELPAFIDLRYSPKRT